MKKGLIFFLGIITGSILTVVFLAILGNIYSSVNDSGITIAEKQTAFTIANKFEVFQVLDDGALANCEERSYSTSYFTGPVVYILSDGQNIFYDDQIVRVPYGQRAVQIGTYRYQTNMGVEKVVPVIVFK